MSLAHDLIDAALAAELSQNELRVFLALLRQTLCYGKASDALTYKRLVSLTHVRKDRLLPALQKVLDCQLFSQAPHKTFGQSFQIHAEFLSNTQGQIYAPSLPKQRNDFRETEAVSEKATHTISTVTALKPDTTTRLDAQQLPYPPSFSPAMQQAAAKLLDGLHPDTARDCLHLLTQRLQKGGITSPLGYLHQLAQAARANRLDCSALQHKPNAAPSQSQTPLNARLHALASDIQALDRLYALANTPMDTATCLIRQAKLKEWEAVYASLQRATLQQSKTT
jgi:phage replication O-like protein O